MGLIRGVLKFYSHDRGRSWTEPEPVLYQGEQIIGYGDPQGILRLQSGRLGMTHYGPLEAKDLPDQGPSAQARSKEGLRALYFRTSDDEGETWGPAHLVSGPGVVRWYSLHDTLIQLRSGRLLWPLYGGSSGYDPTNHPKIEEQKRGLGHLWHSENLGITKMFYSDDEGETWSASPDDLMLWLDEGYSNLDALHETTVAETKNGRVLALARCGQMRAVQTFSHDNGEHWSLAELSELCASNAPVRVRTIPSTGDLMVVWNQVTAEEHRQYYGRCRLSAAISTDNGNTWKNFRNIHVTPGLDDSPRVRDPEPPHFVRPGSSTRPEDALVDNQINGFLRASYANFWFFGDEVLIEHDYWFRPDPWSRHPIPDKWKPLTKNRNRRTSAGHLLSSLPRRAHILPLSWFYSE